MSDPQGGTPNNETQTPNSGASGAGSQGTTQTTTQTEGMGTSTAIDWSKIDPSTIPADVIKGNPLFKQVLTESIDRRKKIAELVKDEDAKPNTGANKPVNKTEDNRQETDLERQMRAVIEYQTINMKKDVAKAAGLPDGAISFITGETYDDMLRSAQATAAIFGVNQNSGNNPAGGTQNTSTGNPAANQKDTAMLNRMKAHMDGKVENPFSPGVQRQVGGGS